MIRIESLVKQFGERPLLDHIDFHFTKGEKIALVGANGAGKTTLLNIICGLEEPDAGTILIPQQTTLGYLPQEPNPQPQESVLKECMAGSKKLYLLEKEMKEALILLENSPSDSSVSRYEKAESMFRLSDGYSLKARAIEILTGLGFHEKMIVQNPLELSGGWRIRLELAKIFLSHPDFLILDEPTNHLDLPSLVWVEKYLHSFKGTLLFVSHDRQLLNRLSSYIVHLHRGRLTGYKGNFDQFLMERTAKQDHELAKQEQLQKKIDHMERFVERF